MSTPKESVRAELVARLRTELVGPNDEHEQLSESPLDRYLCGILWPAGTGVEQEEVETGDGDSADGDDASAFEQSAPLAQSLNPSAIGLSFLLEPGIHTLQVLATWAIYAPAGEKEFRRVPQRDLLPLTFKVGQGRQVVATTVDPDVRIEYVARQRVQDGRLAVSLFLVNRKPTPERGNDPDLCLFQPVLTLTGADTLAPFAVRDLAPPPGMEREPDALQDDLLYRHALVFAVGHSTAVTWSVAPETPQRATQLQTVTIPDYEVARVIPPKWEKAGSLDMQTLGAARDGNQLHGYLAPLLDEYDTWIQRQEQELAALTTLTADLRGRAEQHLKDCNTALNRMRTGLDMVCDDPQAFAAFTFANRAMALQRTQSEWAQDAKKKQNWSTNPKPVPITWYPFQIAFILQALTSMVEPTHKDRQITDLLWFPTGGGKTEAYLGLSALTMALRRLRGEQQGMRGDAGVTVIMRYTLRLLTIQQFQRASTLICAMEVLRQKETASWGTEPFRIGLWVGGSSTPNSFDDAAAALKPGGKKDSKSTPVQLVACPWCGASLSEQHYNAQSDTRRVKIRCSRKECDFSLRKNPDGIPALVEDEEIYRLAPAMIIGTVDKFARIPWLPESQALFGRVQGWMDGWGFVVDGEENRLTEQRQRTLAVQNKPEQYSVTGPLLPPDLIIQDELHLISGPLGTMVGAYESAIDLLASREVQGQKVAPKVIASTATIRRAERQVQALFDRNKTAVFPPPGLSAGDSFFAQVQDLTHTSGRQYVGIFAPPRSVKTALVRVYAALLASPGAMTEQPEDLDPYWTLVGYFNSLRELGGAVRLVEDDVRARIETLANPRRVQRYPFASRHLEEEVTELTSRVDSSEIPKRLDALDRVYTGQPVPKERPVDVVLASNMISVGVDINRLGVMVVTGQPKTTAEYIQATSRVGRRHPGLVITVYNWVRPRDLSHYERFGSYHAALYRYVEAISVTPFSSRARDRALAAAFIAACRHRVQGLAPRPGAAQFKATAADVDRIRQHLVNRATGIDATQGGALLRDLEDRIMKIWDKEAAKGGLVYSGADQFSRSLMYPLGERKGKGLFGVPNSMRDVEKTVGLYLATEDEA